MSNLLMSEPSEAEKRGLADENRPFVPHDEIEWARLRLHIGVMALEFAAGEGTDARSSALFADRLIRIDDPRALLALRKILSTILHEPLLLEKPSDQVVVKPLDFEVPKDEQGSSNAEIGEQENVGESTTEIKPKPTALARTAQIALAPRAQMGYEELIDFYFPENGAGRLSSIAKLATDIEWDLSRQREVSDNHFRAVSLLIKIKTMLDKPDSENQKCLVTIKNTINSFMVRTQPDVKGMVKNINTSSTSLSLEDLVSDGQIGFLEALQRFDLATDGRVINYCWTRIRGEAIDDLRAHGRTIPVSRGDVTIERKLRDYEAGLIEMDEEEIASAKKARMDLRNADVAYFDAPVIPGSDLRIVDRIADTHTAEDRYFEFESEIDVDVLLKGVPERNQDVIKMYFGLQPYIDSRSMAEVGKHFDITESRVSQIVTKTLKKLKGRFETVDDLVLKPNLPKPPQSRSPMEYKGAMLRSGLLRQHLDLASRGFRAKEAAAELFVARDTVISHRREILAELGANTMTAAIRIGFQEGILLPDSGSEGSPISLGPAEVQTLQCIPTGMSNIEIATALSKSEETIKTQILSLFGKLGAKNRQHLVRRGIENGYIAIR